MASDAEFVKYVLERLSDAGTVTCRRMFGEYGLYCDGIFFGTIEDNMLCLKVTEPGRAFFPEAEIVEPHEGAHFIYVDRLDDKMLLAEAVKATCAVLPKKKKKRSV